MNEGPAGGQVNDNAGLRHPFQRNNGLLNSATPYL